MNAAQTKAERIAEAKAQIEELQMWFARKGYGWYDAATPAMRQMWDDRSAEQDRLCDLLATLED